MLPDSQGATCPARIWPPRLGIKLLGGGSKYGKVVQGRYVWMASQKNRCSQPRFCTAERPNLSELTSHPCTVRKKVTLSK